MHCLDTGKHIFTFPSWHWDSYSDHYTDSHVHSHQSKSLLISAASFLCSLFLFSELRYSHNSTTTSVGKHTLHTLLTNTTDKKEMRLTDHQSPFHHVRGGRDQPAWQRRWGKGWRRRGTSQRWTKTRSACKQCLLSLHVYSQHIRVCGCMCVCTNNSLSGQAFALYTLIIIIIISS